MEGDLAKKRSRLKVNWLCDQKWLEIGLEGSARIALASIFVFPN